VTPFDRATLQTIYRYCVALCGDRDDAFDLLQSAVERNLRAAPVAIDHPQAYLRRIVRNQFIDRQRRTGIVEFESLLDPETHASPERDLEAVVIDRIALERVWARLGPLERECLYLWAVEELSAAEIAQQLGEPRPTILSRLRRARLRILSEERETDGKKGILR